MNLLTALIPLGIAAVTGGMSSGQQTGSTASNIVGKKGMNLGESFLDGTHPARYRRNRWRNGWWH